MVRCGGIVADHRLQDIRRPESVERSRQSGSANRAGRSSSPNNNAGIASDPSSSRRSAGEFKEPARWDLPNPPAVPLLSRRYQEDVGLAPVQGATGPQSSSMSLEDGTTADIRVSVYGGGSGATRIGTGFCRPSLATSLKSPLTAFGNGL
jgi:hypothetical protein